MFLNACCSFYILYATGERPFHLVDSDFSKELVAPKLESSNCLDLLTPIIEEYEKRNICPVENIILFLKKFSTDYYKHYIREVKKTPGYLKYKDRIEKLLVLSEF
jgi:hypothetical protein